jgi:probable O-glycosylation ligase (exosortase A-associated)
MRDIALLLMFGGTVPLAVWSPFVGVLLWVWVAIMNPHRLVYGVAQGAQLNFIVALVTLLAWMLCMARPGQAKNPFFNALTILMIIFAAYVTMTTIEAFHPPSAWEIHDITIKTIILTVVAMSLTTNRVRAQAMIWVICLSLGFYSVKGGLFTVLTFGSHIVFGPPHSQIADNNALGLAMCMTVPLMLYLAQTSALRWISLGTYGAVGCTLLAVLGTHSRGALISLGVVGLGIVWHTKQKILVLVCGAMVMVPAVLFMPENWTKRMSNIENAEQDGSFVGRLLAWEVAINMALDRPFTGGGFSATEIEPIYNRYASVPLDRGRAAHSIYFQVLGDHGFVGLGIYAAILATGALMMFSIRRHAKRIAELQWAYHLAGALLISQATFMVGGAALSKAYYDVFFLVIGTAAAVRRIVLEEVAARASARRRNARRGTAPRPALAASGH